jgi:hypothetical protein
MSNTPFAESRSSEPAERTIARKMIRILNDSTLDRRQRETLVRKAQRELVEMRQRKRQRESLLRQMAAVQLPVGFHAQSVAVSDGRMQVGAMKKSGAFAWFDARPTPEGVRESAFRLRAEHPGKVATR